MRVFALMYGAHASAQDTITDECECASGISGNDKGVKQCWICPASQHPILRNRVDSAKSTIATLGKCRIPPQHTITDLYLRIGVLNEGILAREAENVCWYPEGEGHKEEVTNYRNSIKKCNNILRRNH